MESILLSIKKLLGITEDYKHFDVDIIMHINSVFPTLRQLGVGPTNGFTISDEQALWTDFLGESNNLEDVKTYVYLKVKLIFDPPLSSVVTDSINRMLSELEWRINIDAESEQPSSEEENQNGE